MRKPLFALLLISAALLNTACPLIPIPNTNTNANTGAESPTIFVLTRHAERPPDTLENPNPSLTDEGRARAESLKETLKDAGIDVIYATDLNRNRETVAPLAAELGLTPILVNPVRYLNATGASQEIVSEILFSHRGKTVYFCGNRGSIANMPGITQEIWRTLGGTGPAPDRYRDLYIAIVPPGSDVATQFFRQEYGGESSLDP